MRITQKDLENLVDRINDITGHDRKPYNHDKPGCNPNAGVYHLDYAYGGVSLDRMSLKQGCTGISTVTTGYDTKKDLYNKIQAILTGLEMSKQVKT